MQMMVDTEKIRAWREGRCWSQEHLADVAGVSVRTVQRLENGESVSQDTVMSLAAAFDVDSRKLAIESRRQAKDALLKQARKKRREAMLAFWIHLVTYIGVIGLLYAINVASEGEDLWVIWPAIGWGIGIFSHGATVLLINHFSNGASVVDSVSLW